MSMSRRTTNFALIAAGAGLWYMGAKTFADHHSAVMAGVPSDFQTKHATALGTVTTLAGLGLAVYGTYRVNKTWGKLLGAGLGSVIAYNVYKHKQGEPLISLSPFPSMFKHASAGEAFVGRAPPGGDYSFTRAPGYNGKDY